jgi:hypothetical protein
VSGPAASSHDPNPRTLLHTIARRQCSTTSAPPRSSSAGRSASASRCSTEGQGTQTLAWLSLRAYKPFHPNTNAAFSPHGLRRFGASPMRSAFCRQGLRVTCWETVSRRSAGRIRDVLEAPASNPVLAPHRARPAISLNVHQHGHRRDSTVAFHRRAHRHPHRDRCPAAAR